MTLAVFTFSLLGAMALGMPIAFALIVCGARFLTLSMGYIGLPRHLAEWIIGIDLSQFGLIVALMIFYVSLGCFLDGISMVVLTMGVILPTVEKAGIDLLALELADEGQFGVFKLLTAEPDRARHVLSDANMTVAVNQVAIIEIPDQPGSLLKLAKAMEAANLNISDAYGCILERGKRAVFVVKGDNLDAIEKAATEAGLKALSSLA